MSPEASRAVVSGGDGQTLVTAAAIADMVGGELIGRGDIVVRGVAALDRADAQQLSLLSHPRYAAWFRETRAGVVLMGQDFRDAAGSPGARIIVSRPMEALLSVLPHFHRPAGRPNGVHATAIVASDAVLGAEACVEAYAIIGSGVVLGDRAWIGPHAVVGDGTVIGADSRLHAHAVCYPMVELGARVVLHSGARVGREGFGWVPQQNGVSRIPHVGRCVLGDDVEIGANSCVDRGSIDDTIIGAGTKIDSLVQVAHNVRIGRACMIASQVGIAGSTRVEDGVQLGGQVGLAGHLVVGAGSTLAAQAGVVGNVPAGETWSGYPARPHREQLRSTAALHKLSSLMRPLQRLMAHNNPDSEPQ